VQVHPDALAHALLPVEVDAPATDPARVALPDGAVLLTKPNHAADAASESTPTLATDAPLVPSRHSPLTTKATDPCAAPALVHSSQLTLAGLLVRAHGGTLCDAFGPWTTHVVLADEHDNDDDDDENNNNHGDDGGGGEIGDLPHRRNYRRRPRLRRRRDLFARVFAACGPDVTFARRPHVVGCKWVRECARHDARLPEAVAGGGRAGADAPEGAMEH
ncbi:hypothetical protein HK405_011700, partial [Cladochytrium tenue]